MAQDCHMPDLSHLVRLVPGLLITVMMPDGNMVTEKIALHRRNFIRLVDKALNEYGIARRYLIAQIQERESPPEQIAQGRFIYYFEIINHLENCINATRRLSAIVERLKTERNPSVQVVPRQMRRFLDSLGKDIINVRNCIEHVDERIHNGEIKNGQPVMLSIHSGEDKFSLGGFEITFLQLSALLTKFHELGVNLLELSPQEWP